MFKLKIFLKKDKKTFGLDRNGMPPNGGIEKGRRITKNKNS